MTENPPGRGQVHIPHWVLHLSHFLATAGALVLVLVLALDQRFGWFQHRPGGDAFDLGAQPVFMGLFALGALVALRWQVIGGTLATFTAAALIVFANRQLRLFDAVVVSLGFLVPGLLWLMVGLFQLRDEQFHRAPNERPRPLLRRRDVVGGLTVIAVAATAGVRIGRWLFDRIYGPTHPESSAVAVSSTHTRWLWPGAVTPTTASVTTRLHDEDITNVHLLVSSSESFDGAKAFDGVTNDEGLVRVDLSGLEPDTRYHYVFVIDNHLDAARTGVFRTCPTGPASFSIAVACCARTGSNGAVFDAIRAADPAMVVLDGDLHYADINRNDQSAFRQILDHTLSRPAIAALFNSCPVAYVWDDHDFGGNDASANARPAAMAAYRQYVPHYPLSSDVSAVYQGFTIGRVRVLLTDARSARLVGDADFGDDDDDDDDEVAPTMLGDEQKAWLKTELLAARKSHALTIWVNPVPWIAPIEPPPDTDGWGGFVAERAELADFIADNDLAPSLLMASGDAHMLAIDDGRNSDYSSSAKAAFPVFHAGALDRPGSVKGGPYSHGAFPGGGQFGLITITDEGAGIDVHLSGRNWRNEELVSYRFAVSDAT